MGRKTNGLIDSLIATTATPAYRFVADGLADGTGVPASDPTKAIVGVSAEVDTPVGDRISCQMGGNIAEITYGATVARGDYLTTDAQGRAIPTTTVGHSIGGIARVSGVVGDIGLVAVSLSVR